MIRGFYTSAAGMIAQQRRQEMVSNNLANANTPGFREDQASLRAFPNMLVQAMGVDNHPRGKSHHVGELTTGVYLQERTLNFRQGDIHETNNNTDVALFQGNVPMNEETGRPGALFFTIEDNNGEVRYTRNGNFTVDGQGFLTTGQGNYVLNDAGERINVGNEDFRMTREGVVSNADGIVAQLNVAFVGNPDMLVKEGMDCYVMKAKNQSSQRLAMKMSLSNYNKVLSSARTSILDKP